MFDFKNKFIKIKNIFLNKKYFKNHHHCLHARPPRKDCKDPLNPA